MGRPRNDDAGMEIIPPERIRNVVVVGHGGAGKTTLAEALCALGGVETRGGLLDAEPEEVQRGRSLSLGVASVVWRGHRLNLLDAPGGADAIGDAYPALTAADVAVFVVDATTGVQAQHDDLWGACAEIGLPRILFLSKLDQPTAAFQPHVDALRERYGKPLAPVQMPLGVGAQLTGVIDLLHDTAIEVADGVRRQIEVPAERREQADRNRELLVEAIVESDDALLERYLDGDVPSTAELASCFAEGIAAQRFFPVLCGSGAGGIGVQLLAEFLLEECPAPGARLVERNGGRALEGPAACFVAKTLSDPYVGRINVLRVLAGGLRADDVLTVARTGQAVRLHQLFRLCGTEQEPAREVAAGDLVAVAKLDDVRTGDVLQLDDAPLEVPVARPPEPYHRVAIEPASAGDEDKLSTALARIVDEDPSLRVTHELETRQLVLSAYGPGHVDVTLARLERKLGVAVRLVPLRIAYRETVRGRGTGLGRHVKQSGGHGQYGIAQIEVEPLPRGAGFEFVDRIVGGVIPRTFIPSVEKGVREAMDRGVLAGYPMVDVRVVLVDGKHHSVDSSDMAFQMAGALALRAAAEDAGVVLLEPICQVEVSIPDELTGDVMGDLSARRGRITGTDVGALGRTRVRALVPEAELTSYVAELRSLTSGAGTLSLRYDHHEEVPAALAQRIAGEASLTPA